jgi:glycosyltransferase involved in cell wall biosynthesis
MKITFLLPNLDLSGGNRVVCIYARKLRERGHTVTVVASRPPQSSWRERLSWFIKSRFNSVPVEPAGSGLDFGEVQLRELNSYRPIMDADVPDADVVVATWWETAEWALKLSAAKGAKAYLVQHHEVFSYLPLERVRATYTAPMQKIVVAGWLKEVMEREYGATDIALVPNGVDTTHFQAPSRSKQAAPTIGMLYVPIYWKGCDTMLDALHRACARNPKIKVVAFGLWPPEKDSPLPAGAAYTRRPLQHLLPGIYAQCDAWLYGSRSEGFGLPILEAMACRTPVIGVPTGAAPELLAGGVGLAVPVDDAAAMADAILRISEMSEAEWRKLSDAAYARALQNDWQHSVLAMEAVLLRVGRLNG